MPTRRRRCWETWCRSSSTTGRRLAARPPRSSTYAAPTAGSCGTARSRSRSSTRPSKASTRPSWTRTRQMREYLLVFLVAASVTYLLTVIAREIALRTGAVAQVRDRDMHAVPIPYFGGLAMLGGMVAAFAVAKELPFLSLSAPNVFRDATVVLVAGALICA